MDQKRAAAAWAPCILWMAVIFSMSAMPGEASGAQSGALAQILMAIVSLFSGSIEQWQLEMILRKGAHMAEYAVLMLLMRRALAKSGVRRCGAAAFALTVLYAASDEFHQRFVPGRGASVIDVGIDAVGALAAWGAACAIKWAENRKTDNGRIRR